MIRHSAFLLAVGLVWGASGAAVRAQEPDAKLPQQALDILTKSCARCHGPDGTNEGGINYMLDVKKLVERKKLVPGDPVKSKLYKLIVEGTMPPEDEKPRPTKDEIAVLAKWIKAGAPALPEVVKARTFRSTKDNLTAMRDHLRKTARQDRPYQRYFTLTHLHNNKNVKDADLRLYRAALSKLVNHLSWKNAVLVPEAVDAEQTVFAVDLRKLDWDRHDVWTEILKRYPYGLKHDLDPDEDIQDLAREVYKLTGTDLPALRADWFIATASRPPLYHTVLFETLLRLPRTMRAWDLERKLNVDVEENYLRDKMARAGFSTSGVSGQNRMVERHESPYGAYWKSYDFKSNDGAGNLFRLPLGPVFRRNPYPQQAFQHDGGEIIFHLPNGLQGYLLTNAKDERIDEGPIEVVSDSLRTSGTAKILNGLSCMACHNHGMKKEFKDTVRDGTAVLGEAREKVKRLYPRQADMDKLLKEDEDRFMVALERATAPFLKAGPDKAKDLRDFAEPIGAIARLYILRELSLDEAAHELGLPDAQRLQVALAANERMRELGLLPLAKGATIKREVWESLDRFISPFQEAASVLELGTPKRVK